MPMKKGDPGPRKPIPGAVSGPHEMDGYAKPISGSVSQPSDKGNDKIPDAISQPKTP